MLPLTATTDWLSAIGGIVTTLIALFLLGQGQRERRKQRDLELRAQASKVFVSKPIIRWGPAAVPDALSIQVDIEVRNTSNDVVINVASNGILRGPANVALALNTIVQRIDVGETRVLSESFLVTEEWVAFLNSGGEPEVVSSVFFQDAAGQHFMRDNIHSLRVANFNRPFSNLRKPATAIDAWKRFSSWLRRALWKALD